MNVLHIVSSNSIELVKAYMGFISSNFLNKHEFLFVGDRRVKLNKKLHNIKIRQFKSSEKNSKKFISYVNAFDKIIIHGLILTDTQKVLFILNRSIVKKTFWIGWGFGLYNCDNNKNLISKYIYYSFINKLGGFIGVFPPDISYFKKKFGSKVKTFYGPYCSAEEGKIYKELNEYQKVNLAEKKKKNITINIQIGHRSDPILNHIDVLKNLLKYKNQDIMIYIPLNYGDMKYANELSKRSKEMFGNKVKCIRNKMERKDYYEHLSNMDIMILNCDRQIGLGNIYPLLYMDKKVYLPHTSVMFEYFSSKGIYIEDYNKLYNSSYSQFIEDFDIGPIKQLMNDTILDNVKLVNRWKKIFNS